MARWRPFWLAGLGTAATVAISFALIAAAAPWRSEPHTGKQITLIPFAPSVSLQVGDSMILHGALPADCGAPPQEWSVVHAQLPQLAIGTWSDGGTGVRPSNVCGGLVRARALRFTATTPGKADIQLEDNPITIEVR